MSPHLELGQFGEDFVAKMLSDVGDVTTSGPADLELMGCHIEVKTARPSKYNGNGGIGYQFLLKKRGHTNFTKADILILLCVKNGTPHAAYVIPTDKLRSDRKKLTIPLSLNTRLAPYRDAWELIADYMEANHVDC
jgi:hypothetical protein